MGLAKDTVKINVDIDKDVKEYLDKVSDELGFPSTSILIRNLLLISLHDFKLGKDIKLVQFVLHTRELLNKVPFIDIGKGHPLSNSENTVTITLTINKDIKQLLDKCVADLEIPLKKFTRNLIYTAFDDYKFLKKTHLMRIAYLFKKQLESYQEFEEGMSKEADSK